MITQNPNETKIDRTFGVPEIRHGYHAIPHCFCRSSTFQAARRERVNDENENMYSSEINIKKFATKNITILSNNTEVVQSDLNVWGECIKRAKISNFENIKFSRSEFLSSLELCDGTSDRKFLDGSIRRLLSCRLDIKNDYRKYIGPLLNHCDFDFEKGKINININPQISILFHGDSYRYINFSVRKKLRLKPLALFLFNFYDSHSSKVYPMSIELLHKLSGSKTVLKSFGQQLLIALISIENVTDWKFEIINKKLVHIYKNSNNNAMDLKRTAQDTFINSEVNYVKKNVNESLAKIAQDVTVNSEIENVDDIGLVGFDRFWALYPKKENKIGAMAVYKAKKCSSFINEMLADVDIRLTRDDQWTKEGSRYAPYAANYFMNERWKDDLNYDDPNWMIKASVNKVIEIKTPSKIPTQFFDFTKLKKKSDE